MLTASPDGPVDHLFYDGECGLCHRAVRFVVDRDRDGGRFRFAPLGGATFRRLVGERREELPDSLVVRCADGRCLTRSAAVLRILERLPRPWPTVARGLALLPGRFLDALYDAIARRRSRLFARPQKRCPVPPAVERRRFDP